MKLSRFVATGALALFCALGALAPACLHAQTNADIAKNAFQTTVEVNITNFNYTTVTIPTGKRLVIQNVNISGFASVPSGQFVVPVVILDATLDGGSNNFVDFEPAPTTVDPQQYFLNNATTIYADSLLVGPAYAGYTPTAMVLNVVITGYLVELPKSDSAS